MARNSRVMSGICQGAVAAALGALLSLTVAAGGADAAPVAPASALVGGTTPATPTAGRTIELRPGTDVLQRAVDRASPGDVLLLHAGTYTGQVFITTSGTAAAQITIRPFGDGAVTVSSSFETADCAATQPNVHRTFMLRDGVDYWSIEGLRIVGGIWVSGTNFAVPAAWIKTQAKKTKDWQTRRSLPGRGYVGHRTAVPDPVAAPKIYQALSELLGVTVDPATGIGVVGNDISGRGIHVATANQGQIRDNRIHDVDCGIGPGIWLNTYSDFWEITGNTVSRVASSTWLHYMQEGIRTGTASSYNLIAHNAVSDLPGDGRGITTDIDASFNRFESNTVNDVAIGLNDQESGWGNTWSRNLVVDSRGPSMVFRGADARLRAPSLNSSTLQATVACNVADGGGGMTAGALMSSTFTNNTFHHVHLAANLARYWSAYDNVWNGSTAVPPAFPPGPPPGACPPAGA